jgi:hypothetical protein
MGFVQCLYFIVRAFVISQASLVVENLALRQQLVVLKQQKLKPRLKKHDRLFLVCSSLRARAINV